jgi:Putative Ser protein kinase
MDIFKRLSEYRAESDKLAWTGTFKEYVDLLRNDPTPAMTAHARVYDMIESYGVEEVGGHKRYRFFEQEIFGLDRAIEKLVEEYFHSAARRLDVRKSQLPDDWMFAKEFCC